MENAGGFHYPP